MAPMTRRTFGIAGIGAVAVSRIIQCGGECSCDRRFPGANYLSTMS